VRKRLGDEIEDAQGVMFLCPKCYRAKGGPVGTHSVLCWFRNRDVPDAELPGPARWTVSGTGLADLTLAPSVHLLPPSCGWHGWIQDGEVRDA